MRAPVIFSPLIRTSRSATVALLAVLVVALSAGCAGPTPDGSNRPDPTSTSTGPPSSSTEGGTSFPDVVDVQATNTEGDLFDFDVTISSPYDTPERYADGWRITAKDGDVLAEHVLTHDHASEQPFTRSQSGVEIPAGITEVLVEGRDQLNGYGGQTQTVTLPGR